MHLPVDTEGSQAVLLCTILDGWEHTPCSFLYCTYLYILTILPCMNTDFVIFACFCFLPTWPTTGILLYRRGKNACDFFLIILFQQLMKALGLSLQRNSETHVCLSAWVPPHCQIEGGTGDLIPSFPFKACSTPWESRVDYPLCILSNSAWKFFNVFLEEEFIIVKIWNISLILFLWPRISSLYLFGGCCNGAPGHSWHRPALLLH